VGFAALSRANSSEKVIQQFDIIFFRFTYAGAAPRFNVSDIFMNICSYYSDQDLLAVLNEELPS
jgi:hypothetical protein